MWITYWSSVPYIERRRRMGRGGGGGGGGRYGEEHWGTGWVGNICDSQEAEAWQEKNSREEWVRNLSGKKNHCSHYWFFCTLVKGLLTSQNFFSACQFFFAWSGLGDPEQWLCAGKHLLGYDICWEYHWPKRRREYGGGGGKPLHVCPALGKTILGLGRSLGSLNGLIGHLDVFVIWFWTLAFPRADRIDYRYQILFLFSFSCLTLSLVFTDYRVHRSLPSWAAGTSPLPRWLRPAQGRGRPHWETATGKFVKKPLDLPKYKERIIFRRGARSEQKHQVSKTGAIFFITLF